MNETKSAQLVFAIRTASPFGLAMLSGRRDIPAGMFPFNTYFGIFSPPKNVLGLTSPPPNTTGEVVLSEGDATKASEDELLKPLTKS